MCVPECKNRSWAVKQQTSKRLLDHEEMSTFLISYKVQGFLCLFFFKHSKDSTVPWTSSWPHSFTAQILGTNTLNTFVKLVGVEVVCMTIFVILHDLV